VIARDRVIKESNATALGIAKDGYAIVPQVVTAEEVERLLSDLERSSSHRSRAGLRHLLNNPAVSELATDGAYLESHDLFSEATLFPFRATLFDKSPDAVTAPMQLAIA
jgi:hypothetical protein